jgi:PAS domain S-box-containing protein
MVIPSNAVDGPWRLRRVLYAAAAAVASVFVVLAQTPRSTAALVLAAGGLLTSLALRRGDDPGSVRIGVMAGYDVLVALALAAIGLQYAAILVIVGVIAAVALLRPGWRLPLAFGAGLAGAVLALLTIEVAGYESPVRSPVFGSAVRLALPMAATGALSLGIALLFGAAGDRLHALAGGQEQLRASLDFTASPTLLVDAREIVYANPAAIVLAGRSLVGDSLGDVFGITDVASAGGRKATLISAGQATMSVHVRTQPVLFDGRYVTQVTLDEIPDAAHDGWPDAPVGAQLDLLFDRIPVALYRSTPTGDVIAANSALANMLGLPDPTELIGAVEKARDHYRDTARREAWLAMFEQTDVVMDYEMQLMKADGTEIMVTDSARAVRGKDGEILFFEGVLLDVTAQRESEMARRRNSAILEQTSDLVWLTDEQDRVTRLNASMRRFLGESTDDVVGIHIGRFIVEGADSAELERWRDNPRADRVWRGEIGLRASDGREILTSAVAQRHDSFVSLVARDITMERRTARELERLVRSKDEFIASVSHELRTPLTAVVGLASELVGFYEELDDETKRDFIGTVADQASEVAAIVEDLLVAARADTDSITLIHDTVDVRGAVDSVLGALPEAKRDMFDVAGEGAACGDAQRVRQIIRNLVTNAIRYGELPGMVTVSQVRGEVVVAVADKGPGIDPEMIERVFQPYERAHAAVTQPNSVGLGLSVSRWLAEKMGGSLVYENDGMSTFMLRLPATRCT